MFDKLYGAGDTSQRYESTDHVVVPRRVVEDTVHKNNVLDMLLLNYSHVK